MDRNLKEVNPYIYFAEIDARDAEGNWCDGCNSSDDNNNDNNDNIYSNNSNNNVNNTHNRTISNT